MGERLWKIEVEVDWRYPEEPTERNVAHTLLWALRSGLDNIGDGRFVIQGMPVATPLEGK